MPRATSHTGTIISIGYEGRTLDEFVDTLKQHRVQVLIDVRLTPLSRKRGFSKTALSTALTDAGIDYRHEPELGNPKDNRDAFRRGSTAARSRYLRHLSNGANTTYEATIDAARTSRVALLCFERDHTQCHRSCITERAQDEHPALSVVRA
ncbi:MAG TPA: DUF488 domain-containing protein [Microthrixaceae bacterium]|nr:DUF488 domain-containing protein [Microthrixaceae bacterium]